MTTICAVKKGKRLCMASDTLARFGSRKEILGKHVHDNEKIIRIGPNYVGLAGHASWDLVLREYFSKKKNVIAWETADHLFDLLNDFHRSLKGCYFLHLSYSKYEPLESSNFSLLVMNTYGIFEADYLRVVRQYNYFSAIGSGEEYALGAIKSVYDFIDNPKEIAKIGVEAAAQFDRNTGLPIHFQCIDLE